MISTEQELTRLAGRLDELSAWRNVAEEVLSGGEFTDADGATSAIGEGQPWPSVRFPVRLRFEVSVPEGGGYSLDLQPGGEALLRLDGAAAYGLNPHHREVPLPVGPARTVTVELEATPRGLFGSYIAAPTTGRLRLVRPDPQVRELLADLGAAHDAAVHLLKGGRETLAARLADLLHGAFTRVRLPRDEAEGYLARLAGTPGHGAQLGSIWEGWTFAGPSAPLRPEHRESLVEARRFLAEGLARIRADFPPEGALSLTGHAHIDLAWLWPLHETRRKALRSFSTVLDLMDRFPDFHFSQSMAQLYAWVQEDDPALFGRLRERVQEGRWELVGGMWVEPDGPLLGGESWARQLLHGQRYFQATFGRRATVAWLPDTFGFPANLPQLLVDGGLTSFFTTKLNWNETNRFPHDLYRWEGLDGTRVLAHSFLNPGEGYNGAVTAHDLLGTWANFRGARRHPESLFTFGWGDGGGGPTPEMLERYDRLRDFPGLPRLSQRPAASFFADLQAADPALPVWTGEQLLELHRGTFTTQAAIKRLHRRLEHTLVEAEVAATLAHRHLGRAYPQTELAECWTTLLRNQFHDILPGSSIREVNVTAQAELEAALDRAEGRCGEALAALSACVKQSGEAEQVVVWNLTAADRPLRAAVHLPGAGLYRALSAEGEELSCSAQGDTLYLHDPLLLRGLSHEVVTFQRREGPPPHAPRADGLVLENEHLRAEVAPDGSLTSLIHKANGREALRDRANTLWRHVDVPRAWDAWEIDASALQEGEELTVAGPPRAERQGEVGRIHVRRGGPGVVAEQTYELWPHDAALRIHTTLRVKARRTLLRAVFPLAVRAPWSSAETAFGTVTRPTHRNTSWQTAAFEVPAHHFLDLSEPSFGVSLLNDGKYGHAAEADTLSLTLLRTPVYPDPHADLGEHTFTYALYPHSGDGRPGTRTEAHGLNAPLRTVRAAPNAETPLPPRHTYLRLPGGVWLSALKCAEEGDGYVLRVYEAHGDHVPLEVESADFRVLGELNVLEDAVAGDPGAPLPPYRVRTLALGASSPPGELDRSS